jgi:hypothetical protein
MFLMTRVSSAGYTEGSAINGDDTSLPVARRYLLTCAQVTAKDNSTQGNAWTAMRGGEGAAQRQN